MWPSWEMHMLERERGRLLLELEDSSRLEISDKHLTFKLSGSTEQRISVYRLRIVERVPEHLTAGYAEPEADAAAGDATPDGSVPVRDASIQEQSR